MNGLKRQRGAILVLTLLVAAVLSVLAGTMMYLTKNQLTMTNNLEQGFVDQLLLEGCSDHGFGFVDGWSKNFIYPDEVSEGNFIVQYYNKDLVEVNASSSNSKCQLNVSSESQFAAGTDLSAGADYGDAALMGKVYRVTTKGISTTNKRQVETVMDVRY